MGQMPAGDGAAVLSHLENDFNEQAPTVVMTLDISCNRGDM
jgi:hypothetical protein